MSWVEMSLLPVSVIIVVGVVFVVCVIWVCGGYGTDEGLGVTGSHDDCRSSLS